MISPVLDNINRKILKRCSLKKAAKLEYALKNTQITFFTNLLDFMKFMKTNNFMTSWRLIIFLLALPLAVWSCEGNGGDDAAEEQTEMTDDAGSEHPSDSEHPAEADTTAKDTEDSEHPSGGGSEHPGN